MRLIQIFKHILFISTSSKSMADCKNGQKREASCLIASSDLEQTVQNFYPGVHPSPEVSYFSFLFILYCGLLVMISEK